MDNSSQVSRVPADDKTASLVGNEVESASLPPLQPLNPTLSDNTAPVNPLTSHGSVAKLAGGERAPTPPPDDGSGSVVEWAAKETVSYNEAPSQPTLTSVSLTAA